MRRALWIAEDLLREGLTPGFVLLVAVLTLALPAQAGWCEASLASLPWPWSGLALRESISWAGAGPLVPAVILPCLLLARRMERRIEPLLVSPATASQIVAGSILAGLACAAALSPFALAAGALGYLLESGRLPPFEAARTVQAFVGLLAASALLSAVALRGALFARTSAAALGSIVPALVLVAAADAGLLALRAAGLPALLPAAALIAAACLATALVAARFDRGRILAGPR